MAVCIFWHRRDLRVDDNAALAQALADGLPVVPLFIFDQDILERLEDKDDARVTFVHRAVEALDGIYREAGGALRVERGRCLEVWRKLSRELDIRAVYAGEDYEPDAVARDAEVAALLSKRGARLELVKDHVIRAKLEVVKDDGKPYTVYGAYARKWRALALDDDFKARPSANPGRLAKGLARASETGAGAALPSLRAIGFRASDRVVHPPRLEAAILRRYHETRDDLGLEEGTSSVGPHLRFGTISTRAAMRAARKAGGRGGDAFLSELIWREFFMQIISNFPHAANGPFRPEYARIPWRQDEEGFAAWREGRTGYPVVDAAMRELAETGRLGNRARMIAASFLVKHLLIDWRWGEAWFGRCLLDFELASNNGNWQWVAGCGCDAAPYFRLFNPELQAKKFDRDGVYARRWVPELGASGYPKPIVDHKMARARALAAYGKGLGRKAPQPSY